MFTAHMIAKSRKYAKLSLKGKSFSGAYEDEWHEWKVAWLATGRSVLRALGKELAFDDMRVTVNKAGIAVSGEVTLMGIWNDREMRERDQNGIYLQTASPAMMYGTHYQLRVEPPAFMWRTIKHLKDYSGSMNRWLSYTEFNEPDDLVAKLKGMTEVPWL